MKHALAAILALTGLSASAATFDLSLIGSGTHWYANGVPGCDFSNPVDPCIAGYATEVWLGDVSVVTDSAADGTYRYGEGLESITYASNFDSFASTVDDRQHLVYPQFAPGEPYLAGMVPGATITVVGGRVIGVAGSFVWDGSGTIDFSGLSVANDDGGQPGQPNADWWSLTGALSDDASAPASSPAPEPACWVMLAVGMAFTRIALCVGRRSTGSNSR